MNSFGLALISLLSVFFVETKNHSDLPVIYNPVFQS